MQKKNLITGVVSFITFVIRVISRVELTSCCKFMNLKTINVLVDERPIKAYLGYTIMQTCSTVGVEIPRFCYHDKLLIAGNCRICLVEVMGSKKLVAACAVHVSENMSIYTNTSRVRLARQNVLEFLLANHPLDCPICDQGGECDLQDITTLFGADRGRFYEIEKRSVMNKDFGPLIRTSMNRCIHCTRCVRFLSMSTGTSILGTLGRGSATEIGTYIDQFISDELSGNITDLCPVGALTSKPYSFKARPWELVSVKGVDVFDALNSTLLFDVMANKICRVLPYANDVLNECWLTNKARYAYDGLFVQRLDSCSVLSLDRHVITTCVEMGRRVTLLVNTRRVKITWSCAFSTFIAALFDVARTKFVVVPGNLLDLVSTFQLKFFVNSLGGALFLKDDFVSNPGSLFDHNFLYLFNTSLAKLSTLPSFCILLGTNLRLESPLLNLRLNRLVTDRNISIYRIGGSANYTSYKSKVISNNISSFYAICEFKHLFCKNFYLPSFSYSPFILLGGALFLQSAGYDLAYAVMGFIGRILRFTHSKAKLFSLNEFSYFGVVHQYSGFIHFADAGLTSATAKTNLPFFRLSGGKLVLAHKQSKPLIYFVGSEASNLNVVSSLNTFSVYQGSHGTTLAAGALLVFAATVYVERSTVYRNLLGFAQKTDIVVKYAFGAKSEEEIFRGLLLQLSLSIFSNNWTSLSYRNALCFNTALLVSTELLKNSLSFFNSVYNNYDFESSLMSPLSLVYVPKRFSYVLTYNQKISGMFYFNRYNSNYFYALSSKIFPNLLRSPVHNYYGDSSSILITTSKTMALCSSLSLKKNFSFNSIYY